MAAKKRKTIRRNNIIVILIGLILFTTALTGFGGGDYAEKYLPFALAGLALGFVLLLLCRA